MSPNLIAAAEGIVLGAVTVLIWRSASSRLRRVEFWGGVADMARSLVDGGDEREFLRQYGRLLNLLVRYLGRQALILGLSFLPVTLFVMLLVPHLHDPDVSTATERESASVGQIQYASDDGAANNSEHSGSPPQQSDLTLAGFYEEHTVHRPPGEISSGDSDRAWLKFGLSDWEISFYVALSVASAAGMLVLAETSVKLSQGDYLLLRLASSAASVLQSLGDLESAALRRRIDAIPIESPVFLTGLARSGTTILLEELSKVPGVGTHRYRDFPFLMTPWFWNRFLDLFRVSQQAAERPHKDRIQITAESPEAFEEPIWQYFFPHLHSASALHRLTGDRRFDEFESFFKDHIRKILLVRRRQRYLSKENYNVVRMEYLATVFPDARFIVPIRHPFTHVESLVRQHALFCDYARSDARVPNYLAAAGHYEFGPQRVPIRLSHEAGDRIRAAWERDEDDAGYASQWAEIYRFVDRLRSAENDLSRRILVVRYEDFCARPQEVMRRILQHAQLDAGETFAGRALDHIAPPRRGATDLPEEFRAKVWRETESVAERYGYESTGAPGIMSIRQAA